MKLTIRAAIVLLLIPTLLSIVRALPRRAEKEQKKNILYLIKMKNEDIIGNFTLFTSWWSQTSKVVQTCVHSMNSILSVRTTPLHSLLTYLSLQISNSTWLYLSMNAKVEKQ